MESPAKLMELEVLKPLERRILPLVSEQIFKFSHFARRCYVVFAGGQLGLDQPTLFLQKKFRLGIAYNLHENQRNRA